MSDTTNTELQLLSLEPKQQRFIQLYLTGNFTLAKIADLLDIQPNTAGRWLKNAEIKKAIEESQLEIHDQVSMQLKNMTKKAVQRLDSLVDSPMDAIALQAVRDVLDRGGHKTKNEIKVEKTVTTIEEKMKTLIESTITEGDFEELEVIVDDWER